MLPPASFVTLGKSPPLSGLQLPQGSLDSTSEGSAVRYWVEGEGHGERIPLAGRNEAGGLPRALVICRDASILLGNGLEGGPKMGF